MRQPFDEIGAPVPCGGAPVVLRRRAVGEVQQRPDVHERTHREHEHPGIRPVGDGYGRDAHGVGIERVDVVGRRDVGEHKGHGRIEIPVARRDAVPHGAVEVGPRVVADAVLPIRRDVGRIQRAERRPYRQPSGPHRPLRQRVAPETVSGQSQFAPARDQRLHPLGRKGPLRLRSHVRCSEQAEQDGKRRHRDDDDQNQKSITQRMLFHNESACSITHPGVARATSRTAS